MVNVLKTVTEMSLEKLIMHDTLLNASHFSCKKKSRYSGSLVLPYSVERTGTRGPGDDCINCLQNPDPIDSDDGSSDDDSDDPPVTNWCRWDPPLFRNGATLSEGFHN